MVLARFLMCSSSASAIKRIWAGLASQRLGLGAGGAWRLEPHVYIKTTIYFDCEGL